MSLILKSVPIAALALVAALPLHVRSVPRAGGAPGPRAEITIVILNGRNGRPMKHLWVTMYTVPRMPKDYPPGPEWTGWWSSSQPFSLRTNRSGAGTVRAPRSGAIEVIPGGFTEDCRPPFPNSQHPKYPSPGDVALYPVARILSHGTVSDNTCGKGHAVPVPGRLVIFVRPMTFWERMGT